jgi:hypothetical protein
MPAVTAVPELLYLGNGIAERHFPEENATFHRTPQGT